MAGVCYELDGQDDWDYTEPKKSQSDYLDFKECQGEYMCLIKKGGMLFLLAALGVFIVYFCYYFIFNILLEAPRKKLKSKKLKKRP